MGLTLMAFKAPWCAPCSAMEAILSDALEENNNVEYIKVNIDEDVEKAREYRIRSIPTLLLMKNGEEIDRLVGAVSLERVKEFLAQ